MNPTTAASAAGVVAQPATAPAPAPIATAAPVIPATPVTPVAPGVTTPAEPFKSAQDFINTDGDSLATRYGIKEDATAEAPVVPAAPVEAPAPDAPAEAPVVATETPAAEPFTPITKFSLHDEQGEFEIPQNVKLTFNAGGKEYKGLRLDEVVRMAQQAPMADKHRAEAEQLKPIAEQAQAIAEQHQMVMQELQRNNALYEQLLSDPALYQEAASRFQAMNSPEQRLARLEQQRQAEAQQYQQTIQQTQLQQITAQAAHYTASRIAPSIESLIQQHPAVEAGDVMAKFHELTAPLLAPSPNGGVWVHPNRLQELEATVIPQLSAWAQARSAKATAQSTAATQKVQAQLQTAQRDAQLATRQLSRPLTPAGTAPRPDVPRPKPIKTSGDAIDSILDKARQQISGAA